MGPRGSACAPWAAAGRAAAPPAPRVRPPAPGLSSWWRLGSRVGMEGVTAGRAAVRGLRAGCPGGPGWEDVQAGLGGAWPRGVPSAPPPRLLLRTCPPFYHGVERGGPQDGEPGHRSSGPLEANGRRCEASWGLVCSQTHCKAEAGRRGVQLTPAGVPGAQGAVGGRPGGGAAARALFLKALWRRAARGPARGGRRAPFMAPLPRAPA